MGIQCFVDADLDAAYEAARASESVYLPLPNYNQMFAKSGFEEEAQAAREAIERNDQKALRESATTRLLDAVGSIGPEERCRERLKMFLAAGVTHPLLVPGPAAGDTSVWVNRMIKAFGNDLS